MFRRQDQGIVERDRFQLPRRIAEAFARSRKAQLDIAGGREHRVRAVAVTGRSAAEVPGHRHVAGQSEHSAAALGHRVDVAHRLGHGGVRDLGQAQTTARLLVHGGGYVCI